MLVSSGRRRQAQAFVVGILAALFVVASAGSS
jgi:hypothetical protein